MKKLGFIGLGTMGSGMVSNFLKNGFDVLVFNKTMAKAKKILHKNLTIANSPREVCEKSDAILSCVKNDAALIEVLFSKDGVFEGLDKGKTLIDCSTVS